MPDKTTSDIWLPLVGGAALGAIGVFLVNKYRNGGCPRHASPEEPRHAIVPVMPAQALPKDEIGVKLYEHAKTVIAGGVGLLSKRPENHLPGLWPSYCQRCGPGPYVTDMSGNQYMDVAYGTCYSVLGYNDPDVDAAVKGAVDKGVMCTLNNPEEVELAEMLADLHPWAKGNGMVRYARGGGEVNTIAIRLARAHTGRDKVAFCGYHGWTDFYLAANISETREVKDGIKGHQITGLEPAGVPTGLGGTMLPWMYNKIEQLEAHIERERDPVTKESLIAAIMMEPCRSEGPEKGFLERVRPGHREWHRAHL